MIIDAHVHVTDSGRWIAGDRASNVSTLLGQMDCAGVDKAVLLPIAGSASNETIAACVRQHPDRFIGFGTLGCGDVDAALQHIADLGLRGLKFHPRLERRTLAELEDTGVLSQTQALELPIMICGWLQSAVARIEDLLPFTLDSVAKRYPRQTFVLAHLGAHRMWDAAFCARSNANVYVDCSYTLDFFQGTSIERDFAAVAARIDQKLIFGSDFPEIEISPYLTRVMSLLDESTELIDRAAIFGGNILRIIGEPAP